MHIRTFLFSPPFLFSIASSAPTQQIQRDLRPSPYNQGQCHLTMNISTVPNEESGLTALYMTDASGYLIGFLDPQNVDAAKGYSISSVLEDLLVVTYSSLQHDQDEIKFALGADKWYTSQKHSPENKHTGAQCDSELDWTRKSRNDVDYSAGFNCRFPCYYGGGNTSDPETTWDGQKWNMAAKLSSPPDGYPTKITPPTPWCAERLINRNHRWKEENHRQTERKVLRGGKYLSYQYWSKAFIRTTAGAGIDDGRFGHWVLVFLAPRSQFCVSGFILHFQLLPRL